MGFAWEKDRVRLEKKETGKTIDLCTSVLHPCERTILLVVNGKKTNARAAGTIASPRGIPILNT